MWQREDRVQVFDGCVEASGAGLAVTVAMEHHDSATVIETYLLGDLVEGAEVRTPHLRSRLPLCPSRIGRENKMSDAMLEVGAAVSKSADRDRRSLEGFFLLFCGLIPSIVQRLQTEPERPDTSQS